MREHGDEGIKSGNKREIVFGSKVNPVGFSETDVNLLGENPDRKVGEVYKDRSLLMLGGGKDSIVAAEILKEKKKDFTAFVVNDYPIQKEIIKLLDAGSIIVKREIDPKLLEFNNLNLKTI